jgi:predicted ABC-type ATPase
MSSGGPWFVLVAGINGAGKSTFAQNRDTLRVLLDARGPEIEVINPDLITREILRSAPGLPTSDANVRAADECERRVKNIIKGGQRSFVIETVLSCPPQIFPTDQDMAGYSSLLVPQGTRTGENGRVLFPDAS